MGFVDGRLTGGGPFEMRMTKPDSSSVGFLLSANVDAKASALGPLIDSSLPRRSNNGECNTSSKTSCVAFFGSRRIIGMDVGTTRRLGAGGMEEYNLEMEGESEATSCVD